MGGLVEFLFGVDLEGWSGDDRWSVEWLGAGEGGDFIFWMLVGAALVLFGVRALYRRDAAELSAGRRGALITLRVAAAALFTALLLEPVLRLERSDEVPSTLVVLVDDSESMDIEDELNTRAGDALSEVASQAELGGSPMRRDLAWALLEEGGLLRALEAGGDRLVRVHRFCDRLRLEPATSSSPALGAASRTYTALGSSVEATLSAYQGVPLAGVLVLSDGQSNAGGEVTAAAEAAKSAGVQVQAIGFGSEEAARNIAIRRLSVDPVAIVRDPIPVTLHLEARGVLGERAQVSLEGRSSDGAFELLETLDVDLEGELIEVPFRILREEAGPLELRARLADVGGETTLLDNTAVGAVQVIDQELRVLFIAGLAFPEVQFLINTLMRDETIDVSTWLQGADPDYEQKGNQVISRLPRTMEELSVYDAVVLYDPDLDALPTGLVSLLPEFIGSNAGGLVYMAGEAYTQRLFDREFAEADALLEILPVVRDPGLFTSRTERRMIASSPWKLDLTQAGRESEWFRFDSDPAENARVLSGLPGMYWHFPVTRAKPGATILAQHSDARMQNRYGPHVVLATHWYGPGRVSFLACDSTYRWRYLAESYFDGFWARVISEAGRASLLGGRTPLEVHSDLPRYAPGSVATLTARFRDPDTATEWPPSLLGVVEVGDAAPEEVVLLPRPDDPAIYEARYSPRQGGTHTVRIWPNAFIDEDVEASRMNFEVELPDRERLTPWLDRATLTALTAPSGGRWFTPAEFAQVESAFQVKRVERRSSETQSLWDGPFFAGLAFLFLFLEWALRKRWRLA